MVEEIENGTSRIGDLVRAIKHYSYMDQAPEREILATHSKAWRR
jgi:hypothetical protein